MLIKTVRALAKLRAIYYIVTGNSVIYNISVDTKIDAPSLRYNKKIFIDRVNICGVNFKNVALKHDATIKIEGKVMVCQDNKKEAYSMDKKPNYSL